MNETQHYCSPFYKRPIMLASICQLARDSDYDFRRTAYANDPLVSRFQDWVPYYKMKWAIARCLKPNSILEIGVRFGYSAAAFLNGFPQAKYLGIDLDIDTFGGTTGAIEWARRITNSFSAAFLVEDTQRMERFPGDVYDLIHVDGQQDGDGTYHDMQLPADQGRNILADGYFWTRQNFAALSEFLYQFREQIEYYGVIPGYAGELLIRMRDPVGLSKKDESDSDEASLEWHDYTSDYYLRAERKQRARDARLKNMITLSGLRPARRALDLECGTGELARCLAEEGLEVTAIRRSSDAIRWIERRFAAEDDCRRNPELICADVSTAKLKGKDDLVVASDSIRYLSPEELEALYGRIAAHVSSAGVFVLNVFPNPWYVRYEYARKRRVADSVGAYLAPPPGNRHQEGTDFSCQSPRIMKKSLSRYFDHVVLWFAQPEDPVTNLLRKFTKQQLRTTPDLLAIASHERVTPEQIVSLFQTYPLSNTRQGELSIAVDSVRREIPANSSFQVKVTLKNLGTTPLNSFFPNPVCICYHWLDSEGSSLVVHDGLRTDIFPPLRPNRTRTYAANIQSPHQPGVYTLRMTLVQEFVRWFDSPPANLWADLPVTVT